MGYLGNQITTVFPTSVSLDTVTTTNLTATNATASTSLKTPLVEFTDGDDALSIADGGTVTFSQVPVNAGGGKLLQAQSAVDNTQTITTSGSFSSTGLAVAITPSATNSKILVMISTSVYLSGAFLSIFTLQREISGGSTTNLASSATAGFIQQNTNGSSGSSCPITFLDSPSTTSACTYTLLFRNNSGSVNNFSSINNATDSMVCIEIGA